MSEYPIPSYAAYIWAAGDHIWLGFPGTADGGQPHSVPYPANEKGMALAVAALKSRRGGDRMIGTRGAPVRHQVEQDLRKDKRYNELLRAMAENSESTKAERAEAQRFLEELGL